MRIFTVQQLKDARCHIADGRVISIEVLYSYANGKLCDNGCAFYEGGRCAAYRKLIAVGDRPSTPVPEETVRQQAERLGVSISEVRRLRAGGKG